MPAETQIAREGQHVLPRHGDEAISSPTMLDLTPDEITARWYRAKGIVDLHG